MGEVVGQEFTFDNNLLNTFTRDGASSGSYRAWRFSQLT